MVREVSFEPQPVSPGLPVAEQPLIEPDLDLVAIPEMGDIVREALKEKDPTLLQLAWGNWRFRHIGDTDERTKEILSWMDNEMDSNDQNWFRREVIHHVPTPGKEQRLVMAFRLLAEDPKQAFLALDSFYSERPPESAKLH